MKYGGLEHSIDEHLIRDETLQTIDIELDIKMKISCVSQDCVQLLNLLTFLYTPIIDGHEAGQDNHEDSVFGHLTLNEE